MEITTIKKVILTTSLFGLLTACGTPSVEDLIEDPELFGKISQECQMLTMQGKDANTEECNNAKKAGVQMSKNMMKGLEDDMKKSMQGTFGK